MYLTDNLSIENHLPLSLLLGYITRRLTLNFVPNIARTKISHLLANGSAFYSYLISLNITNSSAIVKLNIELHDRRERATCKRLNFPCI